MLRRCAPSTGSLSSSVAADTRTTAASAATMPTSCRTPGAPSRMAPTTTGTAAASTPKTRTDSSAGTLPGAGVDRDQGLRFGGWGVVVDGDRTRQLNDSIGRRVVTRRGGEVDDLEVVAEHAQRLERAGRAQVVE